VIGKYLPLLAASLRRKRLRTFFTLASIVVAFLLFGLAESMRNALQSGVDIAGADRLITMHRVSFTQLLPASYETGSAPSTASRRHTDLVRAWYRDERSVIPAFPVEPEPFCACTRILAGGAAHGVDRRPQRRHDRPRAR
jgi:putative ABC transport system permease protein